MPFTKRFTKRSRKVGGKKSRRRLRKISRKVGGKMRGKTSRKVGGKKSFRRLRKTSRKVSGNKSHKRLRNTSRKVGGGERAKALRKELSGATRQEAAAAASAKANEDELAKATAKWEEAAARAAVMWDDHAPHIGDRSSPTGAAYFSANLEERGEFAAKEEAAAAAAKAQKLLELWAAEAKRLEALLINAEKEDDVRRRREGRDGELNSDDESESGGTLASADVAGWPEL